MMRVSIILEQRFFMTPDQQVWTETSFPYSFFARYIEAFDNVNVIARACSVASKKSEWLSVTGDRVSFTPVPYYIGPLNYALHYSSICSATRNGIDAGDAIVLRVSSPIADTVLPPLLKGKRPYAVEVVGDPYDVFAKGVIRHPLRPLFRSWFTHQLRRQCRHASSALYVTRETLQNRYPCPQGMVGISDVDLPPEAFVSGPRAPYMGPGPFTLVFVGSLAQLYKAPDILLIAVAQCVAAGLDLRLRIVGDGRYRSQLEAQARALGIVDRVSFVGQVATGVAVRAELDHADLFVLPSLTEGLPRAMVEAMARGLPCIGSRVGGIPELLQAEDMIPPADAGALAALINIVARDPIRQVTMAKHNLALAREYKEESLQARRSIFYDGVRETTERWLTTGNNR